MRSVVITLKYQNQEADLELPADVPLYLLGPILAERLNWHELDLGQGERTISARTTTGVVVRPSETLGGAGVADGELLELAVISPQRSAPEMPATAEGVYLQSADTGQVFRVRRRAALIGRGSLAEIDLGVLPNSDVVSRKHANLVRRPDGYWIKDERSANGTLVDGVMLPDGDSARVRDGSHIQFGEDGPVLVLRLGLGGE